MLLNHFEYLFIVNGISTRPLTVGILPSDLVPSLSHNLIMRIPHRQSILLLFLFVLLPGFAAAAEDDCEMARRAVVFAARGEVVPCRVLYDSLQSLSPEVRDSVFPPQQSLFCRLAFARSEGNARKISCLIDTLEHTYERKFDVRGLLALADVRLEALRGEGLWLDMQDYCQERLKWCARRTIKASRRKTFQQHLALAKHYAAKPPVSMHWRSESFTLPVSRDWPVLLPVSADDEHRLPFMIHSGQSASVISEADLKEWGIRQPATEPLNIDVHGRTVQARPVVIDSLHIGDLTFSDMVMYVVGAEVEPPYNRVLGTDILRRLPYILLGDDQALFRRSAPSDGSSVTFTEGLLGNLAGTRSQIVEYPLMLSPSGAMTFSHPEGTVNMNTAEMTASEQPDTANIRIWNLYDIKRYALCSIDFQHHSIIFAGQRDYSPLGINDYILQGDLFGLLRNEASLLVKATPEEAAVMDKALDTALTPPEAECLEVPFRQALISAEDASLLDIKPSLLMYSQRGFLYEETVGMQVLTRVLDAEHIGNHRIDLENMLLY